VSKILIVEDELILADMLELTLIEHGHEVCGIARTVSEAVDLGHTYRPDFAIIDYRLADGGLGTVAAAQLRDLDGLGILFSTGNSARVMLTATNGHAILEKPYLDVDLIRALEIVAEVISTGRGSPPFPHGFKLLSPQTSQAV